MCYAIRFSLCWYVILSATIAQPSLPESDLVDVDAANPLFSPGGPDDLPLFDETQGEPIPMTYDPFIYPETINDFDGDGDFQNISFDAISPSEASDLESLQIPTNPDEYQNPSYNEEISGNPGTEAFPWDGSLSWEEAFPPIEKVIPLDSIFGLEGDLASKCRNQPGKWPLCCRGQWNGGGQRNVDNCDLCRLPSFICRCVFEYSCHVERFISLTYRAEPQLLIHSCAQMTLTMKLGYVQFPSGSFVVKDTSLGYVRQS